MDSSPRQFLLILATLSFVLLNAFFVLSEFSIVKVRRSKLEELSKRKNSKRKAKIINLSLKITSKLDSYLSATQLGITLSSIALGWIGEPAIASLIVRLVGNLFDISPIVLHSISFFIAFSIITVLHVVLGELIPKSIAISLPERATLFVAPPLQMFYYLFYPLIVCFDYLSRLLLRLFGVPIDSSLAHSDEEIKIIIGESQKSGLLDKIESEILKNALDFGDTVAKEIMTPRKDIICLYENNSYEENLEIIKFSSHTRYPFCVDGKDNVLGMIHIRDILANSLSSELRDIKSLVRELIIVPENTLISSILLKMNRRQIHTALVLDEYGGTAGLLTMEDILEEIMGDIRDEYDKKNINILKISEDVYEIDGMLDVESVFEELSLNIEDTLQVTIGGYIFNLLGKEPVVGDILSAHNFDFEIMEVDNRRIKKIKATKINKEQGDDID